MAAQLAANPKLMQAYRCAREAARCIDEYMDVQPDSKELRMALNALDGVLPGFYSNLADLIVLDIEYRTRQTE